jgi:hypothetical protein
MRAIRFTLGGIKSRMCMHIGKNLHIEPSAFPPQVRVTYRAKLNVAANQARMIKVVVTDEPSHLFNARCLVMT